MKRTITLLVCILVLMSSLTVYASAYEGSTYVIDDVEYTVVIEDDNISPEKKAAIERALLGISDNSVHSRATCPGHVYNKTVGYATQHKQYDDAPRCLYMTFDIIYCENCDFIDRALKAVQRIYCCD